MRRASPSLRHLVGLLALVVAASCGQDTGMGPETPRDPGRQPGGKPSGAPSGPPVPVVRVGLEVIEADHGGVLKGKKVGLIMHGASVTSDGRRAYDVLKVQGVEVVRLFGPEHGVRGTAPAGEKVAEGTDAATGLPVVSLYGEKSKPSPADLKGLDALVFDLQDAGVRFYTYESTMLLALEAAAEAGIDFVVLDRPNPLNGDRMEGPVAQPSEVPTGLVNMAPGPLVHGLTLGEMAQLVNAGRSKPAKLTVVPMKGWKRSMTWTDTRRIWLPPSPNLRSAEAALVYPGTALLEATNVSEGRGTESPFLLLGAPWVKPEPLLSSLPAAGLTLESATFNPAPDPAAPDPKWAGQACSGIRVSVKDVAPILPYRFGVGLLRALKGQAGFKWLGEGANLDRLVGTKALRAALDRGDTVDAIVATELPGIEAFRKDRQKFLLY